MLFINSVINMSLRDQVDKNFSDFLFTQVRSEISYKIIRRYSDFHWTRFNACQNLPCFWTHLLDLRGHHHHLITGRKSVHRVIIGINIMVSIKSHMASLWQSIQPLWIIAPVKHLISGSIIKS